MPPATWAWCSSCRPWWARSCPPGFPAAAYRGLLAGQLALAAIVALHAGWPVGIPLVWIFSVIGLLDLVNASYQGLSANMQFGAAYYIPTFAVPALLVTHVLILPACSPAGQHPTS